MALCLALNALLSAIEMAFVSVGKTKLRELARKGNREASRVLVLRDNPERSFSVLQIGITLVGVLAAAMGGIGAEKAFRPILQGRFSLGETAAQVIIILLVTVPYTYLSVVIGELVPKSIALRNPTWIILKTSRILGGLDQIFSPVVTLLELSTRWILRLVRIPRFSESTNVREESLDLESLTQQHREYVINLFDIRGKNVRDVMVAWSEVITLDWDLSFATVANILHRARCTRAPVLKDGKVHGIFNAKAWRLHHGADELNWQDGIRPILRLDAEESLIGALQHMQNERRPFALIEKGDQEIGILTMEDIFAEIVGDIFDEEEELPSPPLRTPWGRPHFPEV